MCQCVLVCICLCVSLYIYLSVCLVCAALLLPVRGSTAMSFTGHCCAFSPPVFPLSVSVSLCVYLCLCLCYVSVFMCPAVTITVCGSMAVPIISHCRPLSPAMFAVSAASSARPLAPQSSAIFSSAAACPPVSAAAHHCIHNIRRRLGGLVRRAVLDY